MPQKSARLDLVARHARARQREIHDFLADLAVSINWGAFFVGVLVTRALLFLVSTLGRLIFENSYFYTS